MKSEKNISELRLSLLLDEMEELRKRTNELSNSQMWNSIALAVVSLALFVHILLLHCL